MKLPRKRVRLPNSRASQCCSCGLHTSILIEKVQDALSCLLVTVTHIVLPKKRGTVSKSSGELLVHTYQASPKFMPPRHSGLTLTEADGERRRYRPRGLTGGGAGGRGGILAEQVTRMLCVGQGNGCTVCRTKSVFRSWVYCLGRVGIRSKCQDPKSKRKVAQLYRRQ